MNKLVEMKDALELRKAEKKGAVSIETIIVSGLLIALAVGVILGFSKTVKTNATASNDAINKAVDASQDGQDELVKEIEVTPVTP